MLRRIIAAMYFWSRNPQYLLLQWIVIVFSTLTVDVNSQIISGSVTITPMNTKPNRDVTLQCKFNLTKEQTTLLYWNDKRGDTLYFYEKGKNISLGPEYKTSVKNVITNGGDHQLTLRVTGCNNSPYKCDIWMESTEHIIQESLEIKLIAEPGIYSEGNIVLGDIHIPDNSTYKLSCKVPEATMEHNLTMEVQINGNHTVSPSTRVSSYNSTTCLYSCSLQKDYFLYTSDEVEVKCTARYKDGTVKETRTTTPDPCDPNPCNGGTCQGIDNINFRCLCPDDWSGSTCDVQRMGESKMLDMPVIIIIVVVAVIIIIVIVTLAIVMCVKKKKGWCRCSKIEKCCSCCMVDCAQEGKGPLKVNHDFQYSSEKGTVYESPKLNEVNENSNSEYKSLERNNDEGMDYVNVPNRSTEIPPQHPRNHEREWLDHPIPPQRPDRPAELNPLNLPSMFVPSGPGSL